MTLGTNSSHFVAYDGSGNVASLTCAGDGSETARYEYAPFGEVLRATGPMGWANPLRFSSKYHDDLTGLVYYGYRYYSPNKQRWLNRDPLGEEGGLNLYGFVNNDPVNGVDGLGLYMSSLNTPSGAAALAWAMTSGAVMNAGAEAGLQWATGRCRNWKEIGKAAGIGAVLGGAARGVGLISKAAKAKRLANGLEEAERLRGAGQFDDLAKFVSQQGDEFGDALAAYKKANALGKVASREAMVASEVGAAARNVAKEDGILGVGKNSLESVGVESRTLATREGILAGGGPGNWAIVPKSARSLGKWGEARLTQVLGNAGVKPASPFSTSLGKRYIDRLINGIAHEAKAGLNVGLNSKIETQILKDAELIRTGRIRGAHWHFFQGAQSDVLEFLTNSGITFTVY